MAIAYHHLTYNKRCQIFALKKSGEYTQAIIARMLGYTDLQLQESFNDKRIVTMIQIKI